jgi:hypothetical protein
MKILLISLLLVFAAPAVAQTVTMGDTKIEATADSGNANILTLQPATLSTAATLNSLSFYVATASGKLVLGVYDTGGHLLVTTAQFTPVVGWNTQATTAHPALAAGTYFLAFLPSPNSLVFRKMTASTTAWSFFKTQTFGALPANFGTSSNSTSQWSLYASLTTTPPPPPVAAPVNVTPPSVAIAPAAGSTLTTTTGTWNNQVTAYNYQWQRNGANIPGATQANYTATASDVGNVLGVNVTATGPGGSTSVHVDAFLLTAGIVWLLVWITLIGLIFV